jgi:peptidoglycan/xylan/chitin deacetylase (PgdA/CDA1 family)/glycosyltransferase involved in cell wall biosynthesis
MLVSGLFSLLSRSGASGKLSVLAFHKVPRVADPLVPDELCLDQFEQILSFLTRHLRVLRLCEAVDLLCGSALPSRAVSITFDDGYPDWHSGVTELLQKYRAPATFFLTTGQLQGQPLWHERIVAAVRALPDGGAQLPAGLSPLSDLSNVANRQRLVASLQTRLKYSDLATRAREIEALEAQAIAPLNVAAPYTREHVLDLRHQGFDIGAHTVSHPILNRCSAQEVANELGQSREILEGILKEPVQMFAYPNGRPSIDYSLEHVAMVRKAGYKLAVSTARGTATMGCDPLQLPRFTPWAHSQLRIALQLSQNMTVDAPVARKLKRVLMVAFHFPPHTGSSGVLRTLNFTKHLPRHGWKPLVLSADPRAYEGCRDDLLTMIPAGTQVIRAFALDASRHLAVLHKYPRLLALPDRWSSWWCGALISGAKAIKREQPDLLWSTHPIASAHLIASTLARLSGLPWVADFRDPMVNGDEPSDPVQRKNWQWLEGHVIRKATSCVFTTERAASMYRARYPEAAGRIHVIENGFDEDAFTDATPARYGVPEDTLLLLHSGIIYPKERDPGRFFEAVRRLLDSGQLDPSKLCIRFRAPYHVDELSALVQEHSLEHVVDVAPSIPYRDAIAEMLGADILLVFQGSQFNAQVPAKIYEYLRAKRPLLALVDPVGDTASQLNNFRSAVLADIGDTADIELALARCVALRNDANFEHLIEAQDEQVRRFSRAGQAERLSQLFDTL